MTLVAMARKVGLPVAGVRPPSLMMVGLTLFVGFLILYPTAMVFYAGLRGASPGYPGSVSFEAYHKILGDSDALTSIWTTIWLAVVRTAINVGIAIFLCWALIRTNTPLRGLLSSLVIAHIFLPTMPVVMAWAMLLKPNTGLINVFLMDIFPFKEPLFNIYSYGGLIFTSTMLWPPLIYFSMAPAFQRMDATLEESSKMSGASNLTTLFRITLPVLAPAILGFTIFTFIVQLQQFETELLLGVPAGIYVYTTRIYAYLNDIFPPRYAEATALASVFIVITAILVFLQWRILGQKMYTTVSGRGYQAHPMDLGPWRYVTFTVVLLYWLVATLLPFLGLALSSFMRISGFFEPDWFSLKHYHWVFTEPRIVKAVTNTAIVVLASATLGMLFYSIISYVTVRTKFAGRKVLDLLTWVPLTLPGLILSLGLLWAFVWGFRLPFTLYGTLPLLILAFIIRGIPLGGRIMNGTLIQLAAELEESSRIHGASWLRTFRSIVLPLVRPGFLAGWIMMAVINMRDLVTVILLYGPSSIVLSVIMFAWWAAGFVEEAAALGVINMALVFLFIIGAQVLKLRAQGGRT